MFEEQGRYQPGNISAWESSSQSSIRQGGQAGSPKRYELHLFYCNPLEQLCG